MDDALDDLHKDSIDDMQNDFEKTVEVVEWSCVVDQENGNGKNVSPAKTPQKDKSIFDSVFTNSNTAFEPIYNRKYIVDLSPIKHHPRNNNLKEKLVGGSECHRENEVHKEKSEFLKEINASIEEEANNNPVSICFHCYG